jgi:hypothetical protein
LNKNNQFKKGIQGGEPKKFTLQRGKLKKKFTGVKQNTPTLQGGKDLLTQKIIWLSKV